MEMTMFDCEMDVLEDYLITGHGSDELAFYGVQDHSGSMELAFYSNKVAAAVMEEDEGSLFSSPSLSRSDSQLSAVGSESSSENYSHDPLPVHNGRLEKTRLCSPLSELARSSSSSLQSLDTSDCDDMVVRSNPHSTMDLSSMMESTLPDDVDHDILESLQDGHTAAAWNSPDHRGECEIYGSSPVSPLDFDNEDEDLGLQTRLEDVSLEAFSELDAEANVEGPQLSNECFIYDGPEPTFANLEQGQAFSEVAPNPTDANSEDEVPTATFANLANLQLLRPASDRAGSTKNSDLLYQHLSSNLLFENCHTPILAGFKPHPGPQFGIKSEEDFHGVRLVHLLLAGAEAAASSNVDLATVILLRLKELVSTTGSTMERVAAYFSEGLQSRIDGVRGLEKAFEPQNTDSMSAFQVLYEVSPYIKFAHFAANQAILEAFEGERRVHIMDYDILEGIQWPSLMQALACRSGGPPHLRITALCRSHVKRALAMTQETGKRLAEFAATFNIPFSFHQVRIDNEDEFRPTLLKQVKGECLAVNCMLHLPHMPHRSTKAVASFMRVVHRLNPKVLTLVDEELSCSAPTLVGHFFEALHHYAAIFDSLEATLSAESHGRQLVEKIFLASRIASLMTSSNSETQAEQTGAESVQWHSLAQLAGFRPAPLSVYNLCQAKLLLGLFHDGYKVEEENNRLLLLWRSKIIMGVSVWQS